MSEPVLSTQPPASTQAMTYPLYENFAQRPPEITPFGPASENGQWYTDTNGDVLHGGNPEDVPLLIDLGPDDSMDRLRRGPYKDPRVKAQTAQTRKDNACLRCRMQRIRVSCL